MRNLQSRVFRTLPALAACLAAALAVGSCSSTNPPAIDNGVGFCQEWLDAKVELAHRCGGVSEQSLHMALAALGACGPVAASLSAGGLQFNAADAAACLSGTRALPCWDTSRRLPACVKALEGQVAPGGACHELLMVRSECTAGSWCDTANQCPGTCMPYAKLGESCVGAYVFCDTGLRCDSQTGRCVENPPSGIGDPCRYFGACSAGLVCEGKDGPLEYFPSSDNEEIGTCEAPRASGPCYYDYDCSNHCAGADPPDTRGTCTPWKQIGQACTPGAQDCVADAYCGANNTCVSLPAVGQPCPGNAGEGRECLDGYCNPSHICQEFLPTGAQCYVQPGWFAPDPCGGTLRTCDDGYCVPGCVAGQTCGGVGETCCSGGICDPGASCLFGKCTTCGTPGHACCPNCQSPGCNPVDYCLDGACCNEARVCVAVGSDCGGRTGTCQDGSCGGCGGTSEPCCPSAGSGAPWCATLWKCECGDSGASACTCSGWP